VRKDGRCRLQRRRRSLWKKVAAMEEFVRGSVVLMKRRCTCPGCRKCASGERHPTWVLTVSRGGKTHTVYLGRGRVTEARRLVKNYRTLLGLLEEIARINLALLVGKPLRTKGGTHVFSRDAELIFGDDGGVIRVGKREVGACAAPRILCRHDSAMRIQQTHPHPRISPVGHYVVFTSDRLGYGNVYTMPLVEFESLPFADQ